MKAVILAGGLGSRLAEETQTRPKPMVEIGGRPILWHIMKLYSHYGFRDFFVALGYKGEYIKRYLPQGTFDLLIADEAHEYKNAGSAQGQAMGVLTAKARKTVLLTGTLMGGYADDLFFLLFRSLPGRMIDDGYRPNAQGSLTSAAMAFMRDHGVLKDIYSESTGSSHKTAKGSKITVRTVKAPGAI